MEDWGPLHPGSLRPAPRRPTAKRARIVADLDEKDSIAPEGDIEGTLRAPGKVGSSQWVSCAGAAA